MFDLENQIRKNKFTGVAVAVLLLVSVTPLSLNLENANASTDCVNPPSGLVSWWRAENNANDAADANHGTLQNGATYAAGFVGQSFSFDGSNDFVRVPDASNLRLTTFTIDMWLKADNAQTGNPHIFVKQQQFTPSNRNYLVYLDGIASPSTSPLTASSSFSGVDRYVFTGVNVRDGQWHHVAYVVDDAAKSQKIYLDGTLKQSNTFTGTANIPSAPLSIGSENGANPYRGLVDEAQIFNRALSQSEIQSIVSAGTAGQCTTVATGPILNPANEHYYEAVRVYGGIDWPTANSEAAARTFNDISGHLATITSQAEQDFIVNNLPQVKAPVVLHGAGYWLGGLQPAGSTEPSGGWRWVTDEPFSFQFWQPNEPNNNGGNEDRLIYWGNPGPNSGDGAKWNDVPNGFPAPGYVVEYEPAPNQAPTADAGPDQTVDEEDTVTLDGSASSDPDGDTLTYSWTQTSGEVVTLSDATSPTPTFTAPSVGSAGETLGFDLIVDDGNGETSTDSVTITVANVNQNPTADAGSDQTVDEGDIVTLDGSGSSDSDGTIESYLWEQTAGESVTLSDDTSATPTFTAPPISTQTTLTFQLTVTDNDGDTASDAVVVVVENVNQLPTADAGADQDVNEGDTVTLDGRGSTDPDGTIASYLWEQTAGTAVTLDDPSSATPSFTAQSVGSAGETLSFELTVTDNDGGTSSTPDSIDVTVNNANQQPAADAGADNSVNEGTTEVQLDGTGSSDADGSISSYLWEQTDGPSVTITNADGAIATFDAPEVSADTPLTFKLTVTDNDGGTDEDTVVVTVNDQGNTFLEIEGFYAPVDMNNVVNTLKGGKSVPLKFEIFEVVRDGDGNEISRTEITDTSAIQSFTHDETPCSDIESTGTDAVEATNSLGTIEPRYDADGGQFIGNWKARSPPGICFTVEVTTEDDSATAYFKTK